MNISPVKSSLVQHSSKPRRHVWAALLLSAFSVAILAGSALAAALVKNGSFEKDSNGDGIPNSWTRSNFGGVLPKRVCNQSYAGSCSFRFVGDGIQQSLYQDIPISGVSGEQFNILVWTKGKDIVFGAGGYINVNVEYVIGGDGGVWGGGSVEITEPGTHPWTLRSFYDQTPDKENLVAIRLKLNVDIESGRLWFDKVKVLLVPPPG